MPLEFDGVNGIIKNTTSDGDITIKGNDGGSEISALTFDISDQGTATFNHDVKLGDSSELVFGAGNDLKIYHDGSNSIIKDAGTGSIEIQSDGTGVFLQKSASEYLARFLTDGAVELRHDNAVKLATTSTGIDITGGFTATDGSTITVTDNSDNLTLKSTDTDADVGPNLRLYRAVAGAASDAIGTIDWAAQDAGGGLTDYASAAVTITDATDGNEDGTLTFKVMNAGALNQMLTISGPETVVNEGSKDHDFRVESNGNANAIFVNGGTDSVTIGASGVVQTLAGIPFFSADNSIYTHDVSGTDSTASSNAAYGIEALDAITTGDENVAIGRKALTDNNSGSSNVAIGMEAAHDNTTGSQNVAIGKLAGTKTNSNSVAVGYTALRNNTSSGNIAIGKEAGLANTSGARIVAIGTEAYDAADTENDNLAIGQSALGGSVAGGEFNVAIGNYSLDALTSGDYNVALGYNSGSAINSGEAHTLVGNEAGRKITTSAHNTCIGYFAGGELTTGASSIAIGSLALDGCDTESDNLAIGFGALGSSDLAGGEYNVAIGNYALDALTSGDRNTSVGYGSGTDLTTAVDLAALGYNAGANVTEGTHNTFLGSEAGLSVTTGSRNTIIGVAGWNFDTENDNLGIGYNALGGAINGGEDNVAIGNGALEALTSADGTIAIGFEAGHAVTTDGGGSIFIGKAAGHDITTGHSNIMIGEFAGDGFDTEAHNMAIGRGALGGAVAGGEFNVAIGNFTLDAVTSAGGNTAVGYNAGSSVTTGGSNTLIGHQAGQDTVALTTGINNTVIGMNARTSVNNAEGQIVIGKDLTGAGDNRVTIGSAGGTINCSYTANNTWTQSSDERLKKNINADDLGLSFINELKPVTFNWKSQAEVDPEFQATRANKGEKDTETLIHGLIAQDVKSAMDKVGNKTFNGWEEQEDGQAISREMFITPLIKAVQELSATVTTLQQEINTLKGE